MCFIVHCLELCLCRFATWSEFNYGVEIDGGDDHFSLGVLSETANCLVLVGVDGFTLH